MTAACLTLLQRAQCPIWPWDDSAQVGLLVEAFPAAQLCHWGMEFQKYADNDEMRVKLVDSVLQKTKIEVADRSFETKMKDCADALDAVICAFAAIAVSMGRVMRQRSTMPFADEGQIAVHELL